MRKALFIAGVAVALAVAARAIIIEAPPRPKGDNFAAMCAHLGGILASSAAQGLKRCALDHALEPAERVLLASSCIDAKGMHEARDKSVSCYIG